MSKTLLANAPFSNYKENGNEVTLIV